MSRFTFCNCPAGFSAPPERHAPDCPGRSGAGKARTPVPEVIGMSAAPQPPALGGEPDVYAPDFDLDAAARKLADRMDYPWEHMPEAGRNSMRAHAKAVIDAALSKPAGSEQS